jgi:hypothetical protein
MLMYVGPYPAMVCGFLRFCRALDNPKVCLIVCHQAFGFCFFLPHPLPPSQSRPDNHAYSDGQITRTKPNVSYTRCSKSDHQDDKSGVCGVAGLCN